MPDGGESLIVRAHSSMADIDASAWDRCAGQSRPDANPTVSHAFLKALEDSGSACADTGWLPQHLTLEDGSGRVIGALPLYLKSHSYGEYVFDWGWAEAYERAGGRYYPKLQSSVPFTPVTGPRLLIADECDWSATAGALISGLLQVFERHPASSVHITFPDEREWQAFGDAGLLQRQGFQYHWENRGYGSFDDFLGDLTSRKRKTIRKERQKALAVDGLTIRHLTGAEIEERHWAAFHRFYLDTVDRKWAHDYLKRDFFLALGESMADKVLLILAEYDGKPVAGAFNIIGGDALYGRNWGCAARFKFLHFEACYYQAIDFAIAKSLSRVEAGAQGEHKIQRGYLPSATYSAHLIRDPRFSEAVEQFLAQEQLGVARQMAMLTDQSPFRQEGEG